MPTKVNEAQKIVMILDKYLPFDKARALISELNTEVGKLSDNNSVKMTLEMLDDLYKMDLTEALVKWKKMADELGYQPKDYMDGVVPQQ